MSDTVRVAANEAEQVLFAVACMDSDLNLREGQVADAARAIDAFKVAHAALIRAEERARCIALIASEECAHDLAHTVDDVNPRKTHTGDQDDAAIYCQHIAKYLAALTGADK